MNPEDLVRVAELIRLAAETGRLFSNSQSEGDSRLSRITELCAQIDAAAIELSDIGHRMVAEQALS